MEMPIISVITGFTIRKLVEWENPLWMSSLRRMLPPCKGQRPAGEPGCLPDRQVSAKPGQILWFHRTFTVPVCRAGSDSWVRLLYLHTKDGRLRRFLHFPKGQPVYNPDRKTASLPYLSIGSGARWRFLFPVLSQYGEGPPFHRQEIQSTELDEPIFHTGRPGICQCRHFGSIRDCAAAQADTRDTQAQGIVLFSVIQIHRLWSGSAVSGTIRKK